MARAKPAKTKASSFVTGGALAAASQHLTTGAYTDALAALLRAWEQHRAAETADLIDELGAWLAAALPPITGKRNTIDAAWRDVGESLRPVDVPRLNVAMAAGSAPQLVGWLDILIDRFPIDPRLCATAIDLSLKFVSSTAGPARTRAFRLAEKIADGRCIPQIENLIAKDRDAWNATEMRDRLRKMLARFAPPPAPTAADKAALAAMAKQVATLAKQPPPAAAAALAPGKRSTTGVRAADVLAQVLADPTNDAPRLVYADILQQQGDPHGELIALQLQPSPAQHKRVAELLRNKAHVASWLGPLAAVVHEPVFRRGFLAEAKLVLKTARHRGQLLQDPLWATVEQIETDALPAVDSPAMTSLRRVHGLSIHAVAELAARAKPCRLEELDNIVWNPDGPDPDAVKSQAGWQQVMDGGSLTSLRSFGIAVGWQTVGARGTGVAAFEWLWASKLAKQLEHVRIDFAHNPFSVAAWLGAFEHTKLRRLSLVCGPYKPLRLETTLIRDGKRFRIELIGDRIFANTNAHSMDVLYFPALFDGFPVAAAPHLHVSLPRATQKQAAALDAKLATTIGGRFETITVTA
ncbi:MAG: TIGR02996 domain-containing protein [Deltaproteobacteria bacterium]|nr:TIGR02996 domain-containing protein [Deltaproteobacteria bacterium]